MRQTKLVMLHEVVCSPPLVQKKLTFTVGTKVYIANNTQINTVMSGRRIDTNQPFLVIKKEDNNQTFKF